MSRVYAVLIVSALSVAALPTTASAGCYGCYAPPQPCGTCYQPQVIPPQYRTVQETVMVEPGRVIVHRTPAQYRTVMVPQTVMVAPEGVQYERLAPQYAVRERVEMVAPRPHLLRPGRAALRFLRLLIPADFSNRSMAWAGCGLRHFAFRFRPPTTRSWPISA
jgi:hypothetical protein